MDRLKVSRRAVAVGIGAAAFGVGVGRCTSAFAQTPMAATSTVAGVVGSHEKLRAMLGLVPDLSGGIPPRGRRCLPTRI